MVATIINKTKTLITNKMFIYNMIVFLFVLSIIIYPLINNQLVYGDDLDYHLLRIQSIAEGIKSGQFPVRVNPIFLDGFGYASSLFYPDLFLYFPAFLILIGASIEVSYKIFLILLIIGCYWSVFFCTKGITKSYYSSIIAAAIVSLSQYHLIDTYARAALGEIQAFVFIPLIVYGFYNLIFEEFDKYWLLFLGFIGLAFCHIISLFMTGCFSILIIGVFFRHVFLNKHKAVFLVFAAFFVLLCTSCFWAPLLEQFEFSDFLVQTIQSVNLVNSSVKIPMLFSLQHNANGRECAFGISIIILLILRIFCKDKNQKQIRLADSFIVLGFSSLLLASEAFPWNLLPKFFGFIQFPWRFYIFPTIFFAISIGIIADLLFNNKLQIIGTGIILCIMGVWAIVVISDSTTQFINIDHIYLKYGSTQIGNGEWLPIGFDPVNIRSQLAEVNQDSIHFDKNGTNISFSTEEPNGSINIPLIFYKGYQATFVGESGKKENLIVHSSTPLQFVVVDWNNISEPGVISIKYRQTPIQILSLAFSIIGGLLFIPIMSYTKQRLQ